MINAPGRSDLDLDVLIKQSGYDHYLASSAWATDSHLNPREVNAFMFRRLVAHCCVSNCDDLINSSFLCIDFILRNKLKMQKQIDRMEFFRCSIISSFDVPIRLLLKKCRFFIKKACQHNQMIIHNDWDTLSVKFPLVGQGLCH